MGVRARNYKLKNTVRNGPPKVNLKKSLMFNTKDPPPPDASITFLDSFALLDVSSTVQYFLDLWPNNLRSRPGENSRSLRVLFIHLSLPRLKALLDTKSSL